MPSFYRAVATDPPTRSDFLSHVALGKAHDRSTEEARRMALGVSVNATLAQARGRARFLGHRYVAELVVAEGGPILFERTGSGRGHHALWGDADAMLAAVVAVVSVDPVDSEHAGWRGSMWIYELWETQGGNLMASFESEEAALAAVAALVREYGPSSVATVALARLDDEDEDCEMTRLATGDELLARIGQAA